MNEQLVPVFDQEGGLLEARCTQFHWNSHSWQVQFWGPHGLRYSAPVRVHVGETLEQALKKYVSENQLMASVEMPSKTASGFPPLL